MPFGRSSTFNGAKLLALRESRELTQPELAQQIATELGRPVHFTTISKLENGWMRPGLKLSGAICRVLGVSKDALLIPADDNGEVA